MNLGLNKSFSHPPRSKSSMASIERDISPSRVVTIGMEPAENAYRTTDDQGRDMFRKKYALSVQEMVRSKSRKHGDFGIEGYWIRNYNPYMDKPLGRKWVKGKIPDFWDMIKKRAQKTPSPDHYQK